MDSITWRIHTPKDAAGEYTDNGDLVRALIVNSSANTSLLRNEMDFTAYSVPIMANEMALMPVDYMVKQMHYLDNDKKVDYIKGRFHVPSSHYDIGYRVDLDREFVDISFSIPKYLYGTSVCQFIRNPHYAQTKEIPFYENFDQVTKHWYKMLYEVMRDFFHSTFTGIEINEYLVEIVRLDLAFNQYFRSKEEATRVAELMAGKRSKQLRGKRGRDEYRHDTYSTGYTAINKNLYYKIYHKGTEFATVGDSKRLVRHNKKILKERKENKKFYGDNLNFKGRGLYDVQALQDEADLILRHEIRFVPKSMSYHFKHKVFRKNCKDWQEKRAIHRKLEAKRVRYERNHLDKDKLTKEESDTLQAIQQKLDKRHRFFMKTNDAVKFHAVEAQYDAEDENYYTEQHFSPELFEFLRKKFRDIIQDVQIQEMPAWDNMKSKIEEKNRLADVWNASINGTGIEKQPKFTLTPLRTAYEHIQTYGSLDKAYEDDRYTKRTYYRIRKQLIDLGFGTTMSATPIRIDTSFQTYFQRMRGVGVGKAMLQTYFSNTRNKYKRVF